jgi:predicted nucleotide-binding protein
LATGLSPTDEDVAGVPALFLDRELWSLGRDRGICEATRALTRVQAHDPPKPDLRLSVYSVQELAAAGVVHRTRAGRLAWLQWRRENMSAGDKLLKTRTFVGSSSEGLVVANAISANLRGLTDCQVWTEGVFLPGRTFIETLESLLDSVDYAILVASPDDMLIQRDVERLSMRDNVLLELGLFMAKLGRTRTYLVSPKDVPIHIPSDLLGLTTVTYQLPPSPDVAAAWLKQPCERIREAMMAAESDLSKAMKRLLVKRLLALTNRMQTVVITLQSESMRSLTDRVEFERIRAGCADRLAILVSEYADDAAKVGVQTEAGQLAQVVLEAVRHIPFPEEAVVTRDEVVSGLLAHLVRGRPASEQVRDRFERLSARYEEWWSRFGPRVAGALTEFQGALINAI